jgi:hypothetical protein
MVNCHDRLLKIEMAMVGEIDVERVFQYRLMVKETKKDMCDQLKRINHILKGIGIDSSKLSRQFIDITPFVKMK